MRKTLPALLMLAVLGGGVWFAMDRRGSQPATAADATDVERNYFEAERIVQLRDQGGLIASRLTLRHDPPGTEPGSPQRWVLTADEATLPADGRVVTLKGTIRARTTLAGSTAPVLLEAESLRYDMAQQQVSSDGEIRLTRGGINLRGRGLRVNIPDGVIRLESGTNGTITL